MRQAMAASVSTLQVCRQHIHWNWSLEQTAGAKAGSRPPVEEAEEGSSCEEEMRLEAAEDMGGREGGGEDRVWAGPVSAMVPEASGFCLELKSRVLPLVGWSLWNACWDLSPPD